jgi:hypothetical protein
MCRIRTPRILHKSTKNYPLATSSVVVLLLLRHLLLLLLPPSPLLLLLLLILLLLLLLQVRSCLGAGDRAGNEPRRAQEAEYPHGEVAPRDPVCAPALQHAGCGEQAGAQYSYGKRRQKALKSARGGGPGCRWCAVAQAALGDPARAHARALWGEEHARCASRPLGGACCHSTTI